MRSQKFGAGDLFAIPLLDGTLGLGHIVNCRRYSANCALFAWRSTDPNSLLDDFDAEPRKPLTILALTTNHLTDGSWPIIGHRQPVYYGFSVPTEPGTSYTSGAAPGLLAAYHGLEPWDGMFDPRYYEKQLIPGVPVPPTVRYKRDMIKQDVAPSLATSTPKGGQDSVITEGPAELTIQLVYPGTGLPSTELLRKRQELERRLEATGAGEIEGAESGGGVMEVYLRTDDVRSAVPLVEKLAAELGFADDMLIETNPVEDEEGCGSLIVGTEIDRDNGIGGCAAL